MKRLVLIAALLAAPMITHAQLSMNAGDTFEYSFNDLPDQQTVGGPLLRGGGFRLQLDPSTVNSGDTIRMEMFEGGIFGTAAAERTVDVFEFGINGMIGMGFGAPAETWADHNGSVRITVVSGSYTVNQMFMERGEATPNDDTMLSSLTITPVPEPSTMGILIVGAAMLAGRSIQKKRFRKVA